MSLLLCQRDSYLRSATAQVLDCQPISGGFQVLLDCTPLYPEGGGQPADTGAVGGARVLRLSRAPSGQVCHLLDRPVRGQVQVVVDWPRRYDHMQQHTAQHLLTAILQDRYGFATTAFHLGPERCDIEVDAPALPPPLRAELQAAVNAELRAARLVSTRLVQPSDLEPLGVRTRGLPSGFTGAVRLVEIQGIDRNTCGGTHLSNTAEIQAVALTGTEPMRGGTRLFYLAGGRVLTALGGAVDRDRILSRALTCPPAEHAEAVERLRGAARRADKSRAALRAELAGYIGRELAAAGLTNLHRDDADMGFLSAVAGAAQRATPGLTLLLTAGARDGIFLLSGDPDRVSALGPRIAAVLDGRGGGRGGRFQGKAARLDRRAEAAALLSPEPRQSST